MQETVLSVDVGTTGCKVIAFSRQGETLYSSYAEYKTEVRQGGICELNPELVWNEVSRCLMDVASKDINICAVAVSSLGEAAVLLDKEDNILGNAILYNDFRGAGEMERLLDNELIAYIPIATGQPVSYLHTLWKLVWISRNARKKHERIERVLFFADYVVYKLTNRCVTDYSLAARSMAFNINTLSWDEKLVTLTGLDTAKFPEPVQAGTVIGKITEEAAGYYGINPRAVVVAGGHDQPCGVLGCVAARTGNIVSASGTIEAITATVEDSAAAERLILRGYSIEPSVVSGKYMVMAISLTGGSLLKWFRTVFTDENIDIGAYRNVYAYLDSKLVRGPADCLVVPYLSGTGSPDYDIKSCGQIYNLRLDVTREDIYKACMEGLCFEMKKNLQIMADVGMSIDSACSIGGGSYSRIWSQMKADIWNIPVHTIRQSEAVALGLAALSAAAVGWYSSAEAAAECFIDCKAEFTPEPSLYKRYEKKYKKFIRLSEECRKLEN